MGKRLVIVQIPAMVAGNIVGMLAFIMYIMVGFTGEWPPHLEEKTVFYRIGYVLLSALIFGFGAWLLSSVAFAAYNRLSRRFGGIQLIVDVDDDYTKQDHRDDL